MKIELRNLTLAGVTALTAAAGVARAEDAKVTGEFDLPVLSAYVWRGQSLNDQPVAQPSLTVSKYGFSLNTWANYNFSQAYNSHGNDNKQDFSELDLTASYATQVGSTNCPIALGGGIIQYVFPNQTQMLSTNGLGHAQPGTREVYLSVGLPSVILAPTLQVNYDFDAANGFYANLGVSQSFELLKDKASLVASASLGAGSTKYNELYFGVDKNTFEDAVLGLALPITLPGGWTLKPAVQYIFMPDSTLGDAAAATYGHKDLVVGSLMASYTF